MNTRRAVMTAVCCFLLTLACVAQGKKTISPEDLLDLRDVGSPQISPDGKWVAFVVGLQGGWAGPKEPHIWLVSTSGKTPPRVFTASPQGESSPRWSPDGRYLAFISKRPNPLKARDLVGDEKTASLVRQMEQEASREKAEDQSKKASNPTAAETAEPTGQIWMMRMDGGEAIPVTAAKGNVQAFEWSPDGSMIAFTVGDPVTEEEKSKQARKDDAVSVDHNYKFARLWTLSFATGIAKRVLSQDVNVNGITWSPDGKQIAVVISDTPRPVDYWYRSKLIIVDRESGKTTRTVSEQAAVSDVRWSPDGRNLVFGNLTPSAITERPTITPTAGGELHTLDDGYRGTIASYRWLPDSRQLLAWSLEGTEGKLLLIDTQTGKMSHLATTNGEIPEFSVSADGQTVAVLAQEFTSPSEIWVLEMGKAPRQITSFHQEVASWNLGNARQISWKNRKDGQTIYGILITPPGDEEGKPHPTVVQIHGGPEWAWWSGWLGSWHEWGQLLASHGYVVLLPNPRGSDGQGWEFVESVHQDWGGMDFEDVMSGVDDLVAKKIADPTRLGIGGWSYGGFMSSWAVTHTDRFKAAVIGAAVTDLISFAGTTDITPSFTERYFSGIPFMHWQMYTTHSPLTYLQNCKTPSLILHGEADPRVPTSQGWEFYNGLKMLGVPTEMVTYPREPHGINERAHEADVLTRVLGWYDQHLK
jgi:dipeptidyl aminopeptidase/acylaminoacyl peptidase